MVFDNGFLFSHGPKSILLSLQRTLSLQKFSNEDFDHNIEGNYNFKMISTIVRITKEIPGMLKQKLRGTHETK